MTEEEFNIFWDKHDNEHLNFESVKNPPSNRPDLTAFILLDKRFPSKNGMGIISATGYDEYYLSIGDETEEDLPMGEYIASKISEEDILTLIRCGVRRSEYGGFCLFT